MKQETYILTMEKWYEMVMDKWLIYSERLRFAFTLGTATIRVSRIIFPSNGHGCTIIFCRLMCDYDISTDFWDTRRLRLHLCIRQEWITSKIDHLKIMFQIFKSFLL